MAGNETGGQIQRRIVGCQFILIQWSAIIFSMAEPTCWKKFWKSFWPGIIVTVLVIGLLIFPRFCDVWALLRTGPLNELGDFLAGVFTPAALGWLIYGYFLQSKELGLQRQELKETRETLGKQVEVLQEQADAERQQFRPDLLLQKEGTLRGIHEETLRDMMRLILKNSGAPARNLEVTYSEDDGPLEKGKFHHKGVLGRGAEFKFDIPEISCFIKACFASERDERLYQRWEMTFARETRADEVRQITDGPEPLKEGSALAS